MLWRALKHVEQGFYIDVGAWSPDLDSVTKSFYERGWRGINIEPNPQFNRQLKNRRPDDKNLQIAVGDRDGVATMNFLGNPGLSTLNDTIAKKYQEEGWELDRQKVQLTTLLVIWQQYVPAGQEVHFLKIDVEGFEREVIHGNDWVGNRPWIVVVEATLPMSQVESYEFWEPILLAANYCFAYADGLNRFYVAEEHQELLSAFKYPPNVFDEFLLSREQETLNSAAQSEARAQQAESSAAQSEARAQQAESSAAKAEARAQQAESSAAKAEARAQQAEVYIAALHSSTSWRITKPLRACKRILGGDFSIFPRGFRGGVLNIKLWLRPAVAGSIRFVFNRPILRAVLSPLLKSIPWLHKRLLRVAINTGVVQFEVGLPDFLPCIQQPVEDIQMQTVEEMQILSMSPRARQIYTHLKTAVKQYQEGNC